MAQDILWIDGQAKWGCVERICPGKYIRSGQWEAEWNNSFDRPHYDYISDYDCVFRHPVEMNYVVENYDLESWSNLQTAKQNGTDVTITNVAHFCKQQASQAIIGDGGFIGGSKKINEGPEGDDITATFSWWSSIFTGDVAQVRAHFKTVLQPFGNDDDLPAAVSGQFATSHAFKPNGDRYGDHYFQYGIKELCQAYKNLYQDAEIEFRILGTFLYKCEVMHAVLVCSEANGAGRFKDYPLLAANEAVNNEGMWTWKPEATGTEIRRLEGSWQPYPMYRRWEHVAFAFHIPDYIDVMTVPDLEDHLKEPDGKQKNCVLSTQVE